MPREHRKRGKKHKKIAATGKIAEPSVSPELPLQNVEEEPQAGPSWIKPKPQPDVDREAPFGYVDADVKAYFRTVDIQIREWQDAREGMVVDAETNQDYDPNEGQYIIWYEGLTPTLLTRPITSHR
jgi:nucleolar protein 9